MSAEEEFEKAAQEMDAQKTEVIEGLAADETAEMPETAASEGDGAAGQTDPAVAEGDGDEGKKKIPLPFWTRGKVAAVGGIAAALVVGVVGIAAISMPQADAIPDEPAQAAQKTNTSKTSVPQTGEKEAAVDASAPTAEAAAPDPAQQAATQEGKPAATGESEATPADTTQAKDTDATPSSGGSQASEKSSGGSGSSGSNTPKSESKPAASEPKKQEHVHSWEPVYEKKWVENWVTVDNNDAWDEPVYDGVQVCNKCGAQFSSDSEAAAHSEKYALQGEGGHSTYVKRIQVDTIHHPSTTSQKDEGYYEKVKVGEKCSSCGATK